MSKRTKQNPVVTQERIEYLIRRFEESNSTVEELTQFLRIPNEDLTIEQIARTQRIEPEIYKQLLSLDPKDGRYVYYDIDTDEYDQSDELIFPSDLGYYERIIDLDKKDGVFCYGEF